MLNVEPKHFAVSGRATGFAVLLLLAFVSLGMQSCKSEVEEAARRVEFTQMVERKSAADAMNDLYVVADGDVEALARMLQATPSVINRIRRGETRPTQEFEEKYKEVLTYCYIHGRSFSKLRLALDDEYGWYDIIYYFPKHRPGWFWSILITLLFLLFVAEILTIFVETEIQKKIIVYVIWGVGIIILLAGLLFLAARVFMLIETPAPVEDRFVEGINPILERFL